MERLTKRIGKTVGIGEPLRYYNYGDIKGILDRLADIEDILGDEYDLDRLRELMNQRMTMREDVAERIKLVGSIQVNRLRELVEADRTGRYVVLPCKVGDKLYSNLSGKTKEITVSSIVFMISCTVKRLSIHVKNKRGAMTEIEISDIRKTVFFTREAAEDALKGERNG